MAHNLPERTDAPFRSSADPADPFQHPDLFEGLLWRRSLAFLIDAALLVVLVLFLWLLNLFLLLLLTGIIVLLWAVPMFVIYDTLTVGRGGATLGMRCLGICVRAWDGTGPSYLQAFVTSALFWFLVPLTSGLILLVGLFSDRRRQVHDLLSGTFVLRSSAMVSEGFAADDR